MAQMMFSGPAPNWSGPYVGVAGGYGWGSSQHYDVTGFDTAPIGLGGGIAGGTAGWNWQLPGQAVLGIEGDLSWTDIGGSSTGGSGGFQTCGGNPSVCGTDLEALGTLRARMGYAMGHFMPYATFGLALGLLHGNEGTAPTGAGAYGHGSSIEPGWTAGAGIEMAPIPRWTVKVEYLFVDLGSHSVFSDANLGPTPVAQNVSFSSSIIRAGIDFHF